MEIYLNQEPADENDEDDNDNDSFVSIEMNEDVVPSIINELIDTVEISQGIKREYINKIIFFTKMFQTKK